MPRVVKRGAAEQDLDEIASYLQKNASTRIALRFLDAADSAFMLLAAMPTLGRACESDNPSLQELRIWSISRFRKFVILYRALPDGIEVLRVLHGARNIESLFDE